MAQILRYMNPKNLIRTIQSYGYDFSLKKYFLTLGMFLMGMICLAYIMGLTMYQISLLGLVLAGFIPRIILNTYIQLYEKKKFLDISSYLEQMLFSFRRKSKIINALEDTELLFQDGLIGNHINKMLDYILSAEAEGNLYEEAFSILEAEYDCEIVRKVHGFMIRVEASGGEHKDSADILIQDRNRWVKRIMKAQKERELVKRNVTIGIMLSLIVIIMTIYMVPSDVVDIHTNIISQISSWFALVLNFVLWVFVQTKLSGSWIHEQQFISDQQIGKYYQRIKDVKSENFIRKYIVVILLLIVSSCGYIFTKSFTYIILGGFLCYIVVTLPKRLYKISKNHLKQEVEKAFSDWMLSLSLHLQIENVQRGIQASIPLAPYVLQEELELLQVKIEQQPTSIEPYLEFFDILEIQEVQSAMRMLYAISQSGGDEITKQIHGLVERNSELQDKSAKIKTEEYLAGMGACVLLPMVIGCVKMLVDMGLLMYSLMGEMQFFI